MGRLFRYLKKQSLPTKIILSGFLLGGFLGVYAAFIEPFTLKVTRWTVETEKWPYDRDLKIAILTDMHMKYPSMTPAHLQNIVEHTNALNPDLVVLLGDYAGTHPFGLDVAPEDGALPLKNLTAACGAYGVMGNHDLHPPSDWRQALEDAGIPILKNQSRRIECHGQEIWIAGLAELWWEKVDIDAALQDIPPEAPVVMMMHNPDSFVEIPEAVTVSLAGHTHAGQIRFPFIGAVTSVIPSKYGKRFIYGHIVEDNKDLIVSSGLGMTGLPLRFMNRPEITVVDLTRPAL
ncbi:MAG: metallophosphoesterase [Pseudomonadota bacterium]